MRVFVTSMRSIASACWDNKATHLMTFLNPGTEFKCPALIEPDNFLFLRFEDTDDPNNPNAPTLAACRHIKMFVDTLPDDAIVGINCAAGLSRSPAIALATMAAHFGVGHAKAKLPEIRPDATPNRLLADHFDHLYGFGGELLAAAAEISNRCMLERYGVEVEKVYTSLYCGGAY